MGSFLIGNAVRTWFALTPRSKADSRIRSFRDRYQALARKIDADGGARSVRVPPMPGVDADMRGWSFFMILEHNAIVNRSITNIVVCLARGETPTGAGVVDPKKDVMPSPSPGEEQIEAFRASVDDHLEAVSQLKHLRGTAVKPHPLFGSFDAHRWHCMFGFHLMVHHRQAAYVVRHLVSANDR